MVDDVLPEDEESISSRERCRPAQAWGNVRRAERASGALSFRSSAEPHGVPVRSTDHLRRATSGGPVQCALTSFGSRPRKKSPGVLLLETEFSS